MTTSSAGLNLIKSFEQLRLTAYLPTSKDVWTIGWGHTDAVKEGDTCTEDQADEWLAEDARVGELVVEDRVTVDLNQNQFDACVCFAFNIELPFTQRNPISHFLTYLNAGNFASAADQFLVWNHQAGAVLAGLTRRRQAERQLFVTPMPQA